LARGALQVVADEHSDCASAELARELAAAGDQLERDPSQPAVPGELAHAPAVVARARLIRDVLGLLPGWRLGSPLGEQLADPVRRIFGGLGSQGCALGPGVADGHDPRRRSRLAEALVVRAQVVDE